MENINKLTALLTIISTAMTIYITYKSHNIDVQVKLSEAKLHEFQAHVDEKFKAADFDLRKTIEERTSRQADETFNLQIYEKVYQALQTSEKRKHDVAFALVQSLAEDRALKKYLLGLFQVPSVDPAVRAQAAIAGYKIEQQTILRELDQKQTDPSKPKPISYDVFWCEGSPYFEQIAINIANRIRAQEGVGRVRVRILPDAVNLQEPRFRVSDLAIRMDQDEKTVAEKLKGWIDPIAMASGFKQGFKLDSNSLGTPRYLSAYICGVRDSSTEPNRDSKQSVKG